MHGVAKTSKEENCAQTYPLRLLFDMQNIIRTEQLSYIPSNLINMSNLNLNILVQSIENLSQQVAKSESVKQQDKCSLTKAQALLDGLKGMFGIQAITLEAIGNMIAIIATVFESRVEFILDPSLQLKLCDVKITDPTGKSVNAGDIVCGSVSLEQPNDIRQAMFLVSEKLSSASSQ